MEGRAVDAILNVIFGGGGGGGGGEELEDSKRSQPHDYTTTRRFWL